MKKTTCFRGLALYCSAIFCLTTFCGQFLIAQTITTITGNGSAGFGGDGGAATAALLNDPTGILADGIGNIYITDEINNRIRKISSAGIIITFAGTGSAGHSGDGAAATAAQINRPYGITEDASGNIYIAGYFEQCVRKVSPSGIITTIAGTGTAGYSGDGGPATAAKLNCPLGVILDGTGNIYITDYGNFRVRKINTSGVITTYAGTGTSGFSGDGGPATAAKFGYPQALALDATGNLYVVDESNARIRVISPTGIINTFAGNGTAGFNSDGIPATASELNHPTGVAADAIGNIYIADYSNQRIRVVSSSGIINTVAGVGTQGYSGDGGLATAAQLNRPTGVSVNSGYLYITDCFNHAIRKVGVCIPPNAGAITGTDSVCAGDVVSLHDTIHIGTWVSSHNSIATVDTLGNVTGIASGLDTILYIVTNSCGSDTVTFPIVVRSSGWPCSTAGINTTGTSKESLTIFPNPSSGSFTAKCNSPYQEIVELSVTDILGRQIKSIRIPTNREYPLILDATAGIYFISAKNEREVIVVKAMINK